MAKSKIYKTAMYVRLSKGDEDRDGISKSESDSVTNQKLLIESYIDDHPDLKLCGTYIDDGYTGTNFDRPKMREMMRDVDAAGVVRDIFSKKITGYSASGIAKELNDGGVLSPADYKKSRGERFTCGFKRAGRSKWSAQTVSRILQNEVYAGVLAQGKRSRVSYKVRKEIAVPRDEWIRCENTHEAIVDRTVFDTVQFLMKRDTICSGDGRESYLYSGLLFCGDCGKSMVRRNDPRNRNRGVVYICSSYNLHKSCTRHVLEEEELNKSVLVFLREYIEKLADARRLVNKLEGLSVRYADARDHDREIVGLKEEMKKYSALKSSLYQDYRDGMIDEGQFASYRDDYSKMEGRLQAAIARQEQIIGEIYEKGLVSDLKLSHLKEKLNIGGLDRAVVVTFIDRILIHEGGRLEIFARCDRQMEKAVECCSLTDAESGVM